jgi:hypothetical protein
MHQPCGWGGAVPAVLRDILKVAPCAPTRAFCRSFLDTYYTPGCLVTKENKLPPHAACLGL